MMLRIESCSEPARSFAALGVFIVAVAVYAIIAVIARLLALSFYGKKYDELESDQKTNVNLVTFLWPLVIPFFVLYVIAKIISLPFVAATKEDLARVKAELTQKIEEWCSRPRAEDSPAAPSFKVGDLITGIRGNPDNYTHLNEGCVCRILSIDERGRMQLVLVDHKDFEEHMDVIGKRFKAPARNFVKVKVTKTKKKSAKKPRRR